MPYLVIPERVMSLYVTPLTDPVASYTVLMRTPFWESLISELSIRTVFTVLSSRPPTDPIERPWPPEQTPPVKVMSWKYHLAVAPLRYAVEFTYCARVDSKAVLLRDDVSLGREGSTRKRSYILVVAVRAGNRDARAVADVKAIGVSRTIVVTSGVVNRSARNSEAGSAVNAKDLHRRVRDVNVSDGRGTQEVVGVEELWLRLATVGALVVPPAAAIAIENGARCTSHGDVGAGD